MAVKISSGEATLYGAIKYFLTQIFDEKTLPPQNILVGQQNRSALPPYPFVIMQIISQTQLKTNQNTLDPQHIVKSPDFRVMMQVDFYADQAFTLAQTTAALFFDPFGVDCLQKYSAEIAPLYPSAPRLLSFVDETQHYVSRWSLDLTLEFQPSITVPQDSAIVLQINEPIIL